MESVQDSFNTKINALYRMKENIVNLHEEYENERKSALLESELLWRNVSDKYETCRITLEILEELRIEVITNVENIHNKGEDLRNATKKKCKYFNRGYCKYGVKCRFDHPKHVCDEFLLEGICRQHKCPHSHPQHCRYWTTKKEGCNRGEFCQYLHVPGKKYSDEVIGKCRTLYTVYEEEKRRKLVSLVITALLLPITVVD